MNKITHRILNKVGDNELLEKLLLLPKSELNSLLLELVKKQTDTLTPIDVLRAYKTNRFSEPSDIDPAEFHSLQAELLKFSKKLEINNILLSPSSPIGSCSTFGCVNQNNVISALRGTETLADPTNMLAIIIADKLKHNQISNHNPVHYATTARVIRGQSFPKIKGFYAHFGFFCIVSSGKDTGSYKSEKEMLKKHLHFYKTLFEQYKLTISICLRKRAGYRDGKGFFDVMSTMIENDFPETEISYDLHNEDNEYYKGINFKVYLDKDDEKIEIGDGGFVDWISQMSGNKKERCLISGLGIDRMLIYNR